jgi:ATP-binding cassette subfamily B (MDR/TAP) protein 10
MTLGSLQAFILYALGIGGAFAGISGTFISTLTAIGASQRVFELIDRTPDLPPSGSLRPFTQLHTIPLELREVWFAFPSRPQAWVLRNVSFRVPAGDTVALVGPSGAGKSTVVALVERFYDVQRGVVLLADTPVAQIDSQHLHSGLGYVSQEPLLLARSIRDNITFGVDSASDAEVAAAAAAANASEFIDRYEKGYDTQVGERGVQLSGGQKQRIAIARAVLAHPKLLLLDEATSAQDAETEAVVTEALQRLMKGRSALVIAHRLSTVRDAANIIVMVGGKVEEQGTHEELLGRSDGVYANLVHRQLDG